MQTKAVAKVEADLDRFIAAFEEARYNDPHADPANFLPDRNDPIYLAVLREIVRVDMEFSWTDRSGQRLDGQGLEGQGLDRYRRQFPELFDDFPSVQAVCFEDFRLRQQAGESVSAVEYRRHYGADPESWPTIEFPCDADDRGSLNEPEEHNELVEPSPVNGQSPSTAARHDKANDRAQRREMPKAGDTLLGFELLDELGRGAFATVFLARQESLADRLVALKVSRTRVEESGILARLQHTNIVPIHSVHCDGPFHIICMPYFGATTLADILLELRGSPAVPDRGKTLVETIVAQNSVTRGTAAEDQRRIHLAPRDVAEGEPARASRKWLRFLRPLAEREEYSRATATSCLATLSRLTYVEAVLWIGKGLAEGLHHAHQRGILHRDLKPANVLVADDGQPMLLDFNLSEDLRPGAGAATELVGGTLPYMSPESLIAYQCQMRAGDARSDIYSLGVMLYELLTCRLPFPYHQGAEDESISRMLADRQGAVPGLRPWNKSVSPAVEAIVQECLANDPSRRYQSADELREDIHRQLKNEPLRFAPEPSLRERASKWVRRHPRASSATSIAAVATVVIAVLASGLIYRNARLAHLDALANLAHFRSDMRQAQIRLLDAPTAGQPVFEEAVDKCRQALQYFDVIEQPNWQVRLPFQSLSPEQQARTREDVGEMLFLMAAMEGLKEEAQNPTIAQTSPDNAYLVRAIDLNRRAEKCYAAEEVPGAVWRQRALFAERQGKTDDARKYQAMAQARPPKTARDCGMAACVLMSQRRFHAALPLWQQASALDPQNVWTWYGLGYCYDKLSQPAQAVACYTACIALKPDFDGWYVHRGLNYLKQKDYALAKADFDTALHLTPNHADARFNRALALLGENRYRQAIDELECLIVMGNDAARTRFLLAQVKEKAGDHAGAQQERAVALQREPTDDVTWIAQAVARSKDDPAGAVKDLDRALECNAFSSAALESKANLLAERLDRTEDAVTVLDRAVTLYPENGSLLAARGVLLARLNRNTAAQRDAQAALLLDPSPAASYQVAGIYALLSRTESANRARTIELLAFALRNGYGEDIIATDKDLDPIRQSSEFQKLQEALSSLHLKPGEQPPK